MNTLKLGAILTVVFLVFLLAVPLIAAKIARRITMRRRRAEAELPPAEETVASLRAMRAEAGRFEGVEALFGCGHRQRIQLMHTGSGFLLRNVPVYLAHERNCHACWFRTGHDCRVRRVAVR